MGENKKSITMTSSGDWQNKAPSVADAVAQLLITGHMSDTELLVGSEDNKKSFKAHKLILSLRSPVFEAMFFGPLAEKGLVEIPDISPATFQMLLNYIYKDDVQIKTIEEAWDVWYAANKYMLKKLLEICAEFIEKHLCKHNVLVALEKSIEHSEEYMEEKCWSLVDREANEVLQDETFTKLCSDTVVKLVQRKALAATEAQVFHAVVQWSRSSLEEEYGDMSLQQLRDSLESILPHIAFEDMTPDEFMQHVLPSHVLTVEEERNYLVSIVQKLLPGHSRSKSRRQRNQVVCEVSSGRTTLYFWTGGTYHMQFSVSSHNPCYLSGLQIGNSFKILDCMNGDTHKMAVNGKDCNVKCYVTQGGQKRNVTLKEENLSLSLDVEFEEPIYLKKDEKYTLHFQMEKVVMVKEGLPVVECVHCDQHCKLNFGTVIVEFPEKGCGLPSNSKLYMLPM